MEKKYVVNVVSLTGRYGRIMHKGDVVPEGWLINLSAIIADGSVYEEGKPPAAPVFVMPPAPEEVPEAEPAKKGKGK